MRFIDRYSPDYCGRNKDEEERRTDIDRRLRSISLLHAGTSGVFSGENVAEVIVIMRRPFFGSFVSRLLSGLPPPFDFGFQSPQDEDPERRFEWYMYLFRNERDLMCHPSLLEDVKNLRRSGYDVKVKTKMEQVLHRMTAENLWLHAEPERSFEEYYRERVFCYEDLAIAH